MTTVDLGPQPTDPVKQALYNFVGSSNWSALHSSDWDKFCRFIILAFKADAGWHWDEVRKQLRDYGMTEERAADLSNIYHHAFLTLKTLALVENDDWRIAHLTGEPI